MLCQAVVVGDRPVYWDFREARWVAYVTARPAGDLAVPEQPSAADDRMTEPQEADVRSG